MSTLESADIQEVVRVLKIEAQSILDLQSQIDAHTIAAIELITQCKGKLIITGMGKSGHIARKLAATFSSTGTSSVFLHPAESAHGDLGMVANEDLLMVISNGGESPELDTIIKFAQRRSIKMIAMTANLKSVLAQSSDVVLNISVKEEACPLGLAPTSSSTASLALGDAIAMAVLKRKGFQKEDFAEYHPGGSLGRRLLTRVADVMHDEKSLPLVVQETSLKELLSIMTSKDVRGIAGVLSAAGEIIGTVTDGDIRRHLEKSKEPLNAKVSDLMSANPKTIDASELAEKALFLMEQFRIQSLFVLNKTSGHKKPVGLLHLQDLLRLKLR